MTNRQSFHFNTFFNFKTIAVLHDCYRKQSDVSYRSVMLVRSVFVACVQCPRPHHCLCVCVGYGLLRDNDNKKMFLVTLTPFFQIICGFASDGKVLSSSDKWDMQFDSYSMYL